MTANDMPPADSAGKPIVIEQHGRAITNSRDVAGCFGKPHKNVIRDIRALIKKRPDLYRLKFEPVELPDDKGEF
jgi:Rha family phage regulatory protein